MRILGVDFTSAPRRAKPIVVAHAELAGGALRLAALEPLYGFADFEALLARPGPWVGGFDFPFGLPAELVRDLGWPARWPALVEHCARLTRAELRRVLDAYRAARPPGRKYAHRATDGPAGSSSPMKLVNPPVALMFREGAPRLAAAGLRIPGLARGDPSRVALEAYPGLLARAVTRASYKNDARARQTPERLAARRRILAALERGRHPLRTRVSFESASMRRRILKDGSGDCLDALLCAVQAAWGAARPNFGLPRRVLACEGWIVSAAA
ncbi:MAG TPA: DUF429 domain-containing protein [Burkholderiales bacterium]|nr:DUF429 domain-containing protein [Burkholderiales bacterium]